MAVMWQQIGALEGGTVGGLAVVVGAAGQSTVLAITPAGGFSSQAAQPWHPLSPDPGPALTDVLAVSPAFEQDETLFVAGRTGVYRSTDRGTSWQHVLAGEVLAIALSPAFADDATLFVGTGQDGVLRSGDGGTTWSGANSGLLDLTALAVAFSPGYAEDRTAFAGTASGLYRSRNGGRSWREVQLGLTDPAIQALAVSPRFAEDRLVLAGTEAHGLLRSDDGGARFSVVPAFTERGISALTIAPDGRTIVAAAGSEPLRSDDAGVSWTTLPEAPGIMLALALSPGVNDSDPLALIAGLHRLGAARLDETGVWTLANDGLRASLLTAIMPSPGYGTDRTLFGVSLDEGVMVSRDGGTAWERAWPEDADPSIASLAVSSATSANGNGVTLLASTTEQLYRSTDGGVQWETLPIETAPPLRVVSALPPGGSGEGFIGVGSMQVDGRDAAGVVLSEDGGLSWRPIGAISAGEPGWSFQVGALSASPSFWQDRTLVARSTETRADGLSTARVWRSTDGGRTWAVWFEEADSGGPILPATLLMPPSSPSGREVVLALDDRVLTPIAGSWERHGGHRRPVWHAADLGPTVASVTALAAPPLGKAGTAASRTVYAGTNAGPFVSRDGGQSFRRWAEGHDGGGIVALAVSPDFATDRLILAVGVGGTIWQIEDRG